jgi:phosphate transport system protein
MQLHLEQSVQRDVDLIRGKVVEMCGLDEKALRSCVRALREGNRQLAYAVILRDQYVDGMEKELDRLCLEFLVRQQPVAGLLRFAYATIKINLELERVGDYAESIARQTLKLIGTEVKIDSDAPRRRSGFRRTERRAGEEDHRNRRGGGCPQEPAE